MNSMPAPGRCAPRVLPDLALPAMLAVLFSTLLAACGRAPATSTPLPPDVVRPEQPTPAYGHSAQFRLATPTFPTKTPVSAGTMLAPIPNEGELSRLAATPSALLTLAPQTASALGIATGGALLLDRPGGQVLLRLPVGEAVTVTGKTADGRYLAVYTNGGDAGWVAAGQLALYAADDLVVVEETSGPGPIATLLSEAMQPVTVLETLIATPAP